MSYIRAGRTRKSLWSRWPSVSRCSSFTARPRRSTRSFRSLKCVKVVSFAAELFLQMLLRHQ